MHQCSGSPHSSSCCSEKSAGLHAAKPVGGVFVGAPTCSASAAGNAGGGGVFLRDSFRPFYLGGAVFTALAVPVWLVAWTQGHFTPSLPPLIWHMHEMVFGFAAAIIVGFLFTAARNWTGLPLPAGASLAVVFALWVAGRVGMFFFYGPVAAVIDSALLLVVAGVLARKFIRARSLCSMPLVVVLLTLGASNVVFHASMLGWAGIAPAAAVEAGLMLVVLIEMIVGGRVVPGFTANAIPGVRQYRAAWLHRGAFLLAAAAFASDVFRLPSLWIGAVAIAAGLVVGVQALGWNPLAARSRPMLWVLHLAYAWIPIGLVLLGLAAMGVVPRSAAIHALAVGSMGGLIIGMITRTALGHSGRPVQAGRAEVVMYLLVAAAAVIRVAGSLIPAVYLPAMTAAGVAWSAAFAMYAIVYAPVLTCPRIPAGLPRQMLAGGR